MKKKQQYPGHFRTTIEILFIISIFILLVDVAKAQHHQLYYKMVKDGDSVGSLTVTDTRSDEERIISTRMNASVPSLFFDIDVADSKKVIYHGQVLQSAFTSRNILNGRTKSTTTQLHKGVYTDGQHPIQSLLHFPTVKFSMTMLYTSEPAGLKMIYSEFFRQMVPVEKAGEHIYNISLPDGQTGTYFYEKGMCIRIETTTPWAKVIAIMVNNSIVLK